MIVIMITLMLKKKFFFLRSIQQFFCVSLIDLKLNNFFFRFGIINIIVVNFL